MGNLFAPSSIVQTCTQQSVDATTCQWNTPTRTCICLSFSSMVVQLTKRFFQYFSAMEFRRTGPPWACHRLRPVKTKMSILLFCKVSQKPSVLYNTAGQHFRNPADVSMRWFRHTRVEKRPPVIEGCDHQLPLHP